MKTLSNEILNVYSKLMSIFRNSEFLNDSLQNAMIALLEGKIFIPSNRDKEIFIRHICRNLSRDMVRKENRLDLLKQSNGKFIESLNDGITENYINEVIQQIEKRLKDKFDLQVIFRLYHIIGMSQSEISEKLNVNQSTIARKLKTIGNRIDKVKVKYFYDNRYVRKVCQAKREKIKYPNLKEANGMPYEIDITEYLESQSNEVKSNYFVKCFEVNRIAIKKQFKVKKEINSYQKINSRDQFVYVNNVYDKSSGFASKL